MSDTLASLRRKIAGAGDLESVVRSMKALAAASIGQYEKVGAGAGGLLSHRGARPGCLLEEAERPPPGKTGRASAAAKSGERYRLRVGSGTRRPIQ